MRLVVFCLLTATSVLADSHPSWWTYASPEATALVGLRWETLGQSPFQEALSAEFSSEGSLHFPELDCLRQARQILISAPPLLALESGTFPPAALRDQAAKKGLHAASYRGVSLWIGPGEVLSIAQVSEQLLLIGSRKTLEGAIDRSTMENPRYSPLLSRAARLADADLWVVASQLPDPLASLFVPIDAEAKWFEGFITWDGGLEVEATVVTASESKADEVAEALRGSIAALPGFGQKFRVEATGASVALKLVASPEELNAGLRAQPKPVAAARPAPPQPEPVPVGPQVIRITGLDDGPLEIPFPSK